jgi:hypothetical protein
MNYFPWGYRSALLRAIANGEKAKGRPVYVMEIY